MTEITYTLVRSKRKTLALTIDGEAQLIVRAPMKLSEEMIRDFIRKKAPWISNKKRQVLDNGARHSMLELKDGKNVLHQGRSYVIQRKNTPEVSMEGNSLIIPQDMMLDTFAAWMKGQADNTIRERVEYYASQMGVQYASIKMSDAKRRWGSCGVKNSLNFAWRLVMCPRAVVDYVVVHELSHITIKDHSAKFWARVATVLPNYKESQDWLRLNRKIMDVI